jgi:hypothetical protein
LLKGKKLIVRCRQGDHVEEYIPSSVLANDLPCILIEGNHHWYKEGAKCIEVRPIAQAWSWDVPKVWRATLRPRDHLLLGEASKELEIGTSRLVDVHSPLYAHFSLILQSLEPQPNGLLVTIDDNRPMSPVSVYIPRHDLTFCVNSVNRLECQSFPGFVLDPNFQGIGTLIGLETMISLCNDEISPSQRKVIVPKGILSSQIGLFGHPSISIQLQDQGGYFAYEVDGLLGRLQGSRSVESDLFLIQLHAFTSSSLPDDLTGRSGTSEALEYLSGSSCFSMHTFSEETRSYLDHLATLTPARTLSSPDGQIMEFIKWNPTLPVLSQHPAFLPLVESILDYWRRVAVFHSFGDLLKPIQRPFGMTRLSARAWAHNWIFHHPTHFRETVEDLAYQPRDCMREMESQEREMLAYQVACLCRSSTSTFPHFSSPRNEVKRWGSIYAAESWNWGDIPRWLPHARSMGKIWQSLYKSCLEMVVWPPNFEVTTTLSLLGYCKAPFEFLATLAAIARRPHLVPPSPSLTQSLDLSQGEKFNKDKIRSILLTYTIPYEESRESRIHRGSNEGQQAYETRERQARQSYQDAVSRQIKGVIAELQNQWPNVPNSLNLSARRLLKLSQECRQRLQSTLSGWSHNQDFILHIASIPTALADSYIERINGTLYSPVVNVPLRDFVEIRLQTMNDSLCTMPAPPPDCIPSGNSRSDRVLRPRPSDVSNNLTSLLTFLNKAAQSELEQRYVLNLSESINAARPASEACGKLPTINALSSVMEVTEDSHTMELHRIKDALTPRDYTTVLRKAAGLFPAITPMTLLRQLSFKNRQFMSGAWRDCIIEYAIRLHDAKRARRMLHLLQADWKTQLSLEHQYWREWDPSLYLDWLLIEIDNNFSIRPEQANMALEMLMPSNGRNSVMQMNMGEGKSSVSNSRRMGRSC